MCSSKCKPRAERSLLSKKFSRFSISAGQSDIDKGQFTVPIPIGNIVVADTETGPDHVFETLAMHEQKGWWDLKVEAQEMLRIVAAMLQTINQPRYVRRSQRDVSQIKRQRIKNSLGRYIPDAWNMISWNVDAPVVSKTSEEGTGSRQGLHYRRGHWRKAESHWAAHWSETRKAGNVYPRLRSRTPKIRCFKKFSYRGMIRNDR